MQSSRTAYYADFVIYAVVVLALALQATAHSQWNGRLEWLSAFAAGMAVWTLLEYALHRWVMHGVPIIARLHEEHHRAPRALLATPTWLTLAVFWCVFFLPAWLGGSLVVASGLTAGVMMGYLWYGILHHATHHDRPRLLVVWLQNCKHRHLRHHASRQGVNFGVTTSLWDHLFGTAERRPGREPQNVRYRLR